MAVMSPPSVDGIKEITLGELAVFNYLKATLPDSHYAWYDTMVNNVNPDFIILGPELGVVVLEVKDWDIRSIEKADANTFQLRGLKKVLANPLNQARNYSRKIAEALEGNEGLRQVTGKYAGRLKLNFGYAVVFSKITEADFTNSPHGRSIPVEYLLFKDDLINSDVTHLFKKLLRSVPGGSNFTQLDSQDVEVIKSIIAREPIPDITSAPQVKPIPSEQKGSPKDIKLSPEQSIIYEKLKEWRSRKAAELKLSPFVIASTQLLIDVIQAHPTHVEDLLSIRGFESEQMREYGKEIIEIFVGENKKEVASSSRKKKSYLYPIGTGVLCACIAVGTFVFGSYHREEPPSTPKPSMSVAQATVKEKPQAPAEALPSKVASKPRLPEKAESKPRDVSHVNQTSSPSTPVPPAKSVKKPIEGIWIKGNIREDGSKVYHVPGQKYYSATNPEEWFETEEDALKAGYKKAKDMGARKPVEGIRIKGNISADGQKIYHMPGQEYYSKVDPEEWFETEEDALKAGFRKSKR